MTQERHERMLKYFFRDSLIYAIPGVLSRGIWFFLLPLLAHYLTPSEMGVVELFTIFFVILRIVLSLEITQAVARFLPEAPSKTDKVLYGSTAFWFTAFMFLLCLTLCLLFPAIISKFLFGSRSYSREIMLSGFSMFTAALFVAVQNQLRWVCDATGAAFAAVIMSLGTAITVVFCLTFLNLTVASILFGELVGSALGLAFALRTARKSVPIVFQFSGRKLIELLKFSYPLVLSAGAVYIMIVADRLVINSILGTDAVGIYSIAAKIASAVTLVTGLVQSSINPLVMNSYKKKDTPAEIELIFSLVIFLLLSILLGLALFSRDIVLLLADEKFIAAAPLVLGVSSAAALLNLYYFAPGLGIAMKTKTIAAIYILIAALNVSLNFTLVPVYGLDGAMYATILAAVLQVLCVFSLGCRVYPIPYRLLRYLSAVCVFTFLICVFDQEVSYIRAVILFSGIALFGVILIPLKRVTNALQNG